MVQESSFIQIRDELISVCKDACSVWNSLQGQEFAFERGWLQDDEQSQYFEDKELFESSLKIYSKLRIEIKERFPEEVKLFAKEQYDQLTHLIVNSKKDEPDYNPEWRSLRRNWSALMEGKKTPYNEFWAWGSVLGN